MKTKKDILQAQFIAARNIWLDSVSQCGKLQWEQRKTIKAQYADMQSASTALTDDETQAREMVAAGLY